MTKLKIEYDEQICIGSTLCVSEAGEFFALDDNEYTILQGGTKDEGVTTLIVEVDEATAEKLSRAETGCPVQAIKINSA